MTLRTLGIFERALFLSDQHSPFNVVSVLQLEHAPAPKSIQRALHILQQRHPLLQAYIKKGKFVRLSNPSFSFKVIEKQEDINWLNIVEQELNTRLILADGLFRGIYIYSPNQANLILTFHHAIMDAASGTNLLDELLRICVALQTNNEPHLPTLEVVPPIEQRFPPSFKGVRVVAKMMGYAMTQMIEEIQYQAGVRGKPTAPVHLGGRGFPATLVLPEPLVDALSKHCRSEKVTLNSLLNASLLLATNRQLYAGNRLPMQTFTFADLRPYTIPPTSAEHLANYISMLRFAVNVSGKIDIWELTRNLHDKIYRALKQGDKFLASR